VNMQDYYQILGVSRDAGQDEIKKAYRRLALCYHPDRHQQEKEKAEEKFKEVNEAYQILGDDDKRRQYDSLTAWSQNRRRFIIVDDDMYDRSGRTLDREALMKLLEEFAALGINIRDVMGYSQRGCRRGYGRRCRRW